MTSAVFAGGSYHDDGDDEDDKDNVPEVIWLQAQQYAINLLPVCLILAIYSLKMVFNTIYYQHLYRYVNSVVVCQNEKKKKPLKLQRE